MCNIFSALNYGSVPDWLAVIATVATLVIAMKALHTWKAEKLFDVGIEMLSSSRKAIGFIAALRFALQFTGEVDSERESRYFAENPDVPKEANSYLVFQTRRASNDELFKEMLRLREIAWATYGEEHIFFRFYERIITLSYELESKHRELVELYKEKDNMGHEDFTRELMPLMNFLYSLKDDVIAPELDRLHSEMVQQRTKAPVRGQSDDD